MKKRRDGLDNFEKGNISMKYEASITGRYHASHQCRDQIGRGRVVLVPHSAGTFPAIWRVSDSSLSLSSRGTQARRRDAHSRRESRVHGQTAAQCYSADSWICGAARRLDQRGGETSIGGLPRPSKSWLRDSKAGLYQQSMCLIGWASTNWLRCIDSLFRSPGCRCSRNRPETIS